MKTVFEQLEELQAVKAKLLAEFREGATEERIETILPLIRKNEADIIEARMALKLENVNKEQQREREAARIAWEAEQPIIDVTNNDGSFHSVKIKKYPNLAKCDRAVFKDGLYTSIRVGQYSFTMHHTHHQYNTPTTYTRPATFEQFLTLNSVMLQDMTLEQYREINEKMIEAAKVLEEAKKVHSDAMSSLNASFLSTIGLIRQDREGIYTMNF